MVKTQSLHFAYSPQTSFHFPDIQLDKGENLLILGESGIGKTTLLHLLAGLLKPNSGYVELMGTSLQALSLAQLDQFRGQHIGLVFQRPHFIKTLSVQENLALVQYLAGKAPDQQRIREVLNSLGIGHKSSHKPYRLSQGEQQRAAIALAVVNRPQLILADEPTASLDDKNCARVAELLQEQAAGTGAQLIIITHDSRLKPYFNRTLAL
jgi:putative ABC transport system ATP-binding protein